MCVCESVIRITPLQNKKKPLITKPKLRQISILFLQKNQKGGKGRGTARFIRYYPAAPKSPFLENRKEEQKPKKRSFNSTSSILTDHVHLAVLFGFVDEFLNYFCRDCEIVVPENRTICCAQNVSYVKSPKLLCPFGDFT